MGVPSIQLDSVSAYNVHDAEPVLFLGQTMSDHSRLQMSICMGCAVELGLVAKYISPGPKWRGAVPHPAISCRDCGYTVQEPCFEPIPDDRHLCARFKGHDGDHSLDCVCATKPGDEAAAVQRRS
jgi:ribosomal protein L40E